MNFQLKVSEKLDLLQSPGSKFHVLGITVYVKAREIFFTIKLYLPAKLSANLLRMKNRTCNFRSFQDSFRILKNRGQNKIKHPKYSLLSVLCEEIQNEIKLVLVIKKTATKMPRK